MALYLLSNFRGELRPTYLCSRVRNDRSRSSKVVLAPIESA